MLRRAPLLLVLLLIACGLPGQVASRTAEGLSCPTGALHFEQVADDSWEGAGTTHHCTRYLATGCGRVATVDHFRSDGWGEGSVHVREDRRPEQLAPCGAVH